MEAARLSRSSLWGQPRRLTVGGKRGRCHLYQTLRFSHRPGGRDDRAGAGA